MEIVAMEEKDNIRQNPFKNINFNILILYLLNNI